MRWCERAVAGAMRRKLRFRASDRFARGDVGYQRDPRFLAAERLVEGAAVDRKEAENEMESGVDVQSGRTIDAIRLDGWRSRERVRDRL